MRHFDELEYLRYLDGQTPASRAADIKAHAEVCSDCRALIAALERETLLLRETLTEADEALPIRFQPKTSEDLSWVGLGVLGLAATGMYTLWSWFLLPWWQSLQSVGVDQETVLTVLLFKGVLWEGWSTMGQNIIRGATMILSALVLVSVGRWSWRHVKPLTSAMMAVAWLCLSPAASEAAVIEHDIESYVLPRDRVIENDLIVAAETVRIEGTIHGDLIAVAETITVTGHVKGDILAFCQDLRVDGQVDGSIRSGSEFLEVSGRVGRNITSGAERVDLRSEGVVNGSLTAGARRVNLDGRIGGDIILAAHRNSVNAKIGGGALLASEQLTIGPAAEIQGEAKYYGAEEPEVAPEANLASPLKVEIVEETPRYQKPETYMMPLLKWAAAFIFGLVGVLLMPRAYQSVVNSTARYGPSILVGAAALFVIPVVSAIACCTLVGIPIGLTALFLYLAALYAGQVFVGSWLGKEILGESSTQGQALGQLALGLGLLHAVGQVPFVGKLVSIVVLLWGLGALVLALIARGQPASASA